jgi:hypothetical protein
MDKLLKKWNLKFQTRSQKSWKALTKQKIPSKEGNFEFEIWNQESKILRVWKTKLHLENENVNKNRRSKSLKSVGYFVFILNSNKIFEKIQKRIENLASPWNLKFMKYLSFYPQILIWKLNIEKLAFRVSAKSRQISGNGFYFKSQNLITLNGLM